MMQGLEQSKLEQEMDSLVQEHCMTEQQVLGS
jgi:hypothetical protein